ncbi:hypothetical protein D9758_014520 [Tetrapyrgos nigripes]|uniref:Uncharacterized protein n=1 Tax=Tetrapyrgos nigripes TaxID=182062 RepID=A0A8H5CT18_9AGAR|nr:hypothetical protein D9758_014520 [Tetrapyrgos nigripes]
MAAPLLSLTNPTNAQDAAALITELKHVLLDCRQKALTPLKASEWQKALEETSLLCKYPNLPLSIQHGFNVSIPHIKHTFSPPNNIFTDEHKAAFQKVVEKELRLGCWLGPYPQHIIEEVLGPFQTSLITMIPKAAKPGSFCPVQNLSFPPKPITQYIPTPSSIPITIFSINSQIDSTLYPCLWGTFANTCRLLWTVPPRTQGAVCNVSKAYHSIPLHPNQWAGTVVHIDDNTCDMFSLASAGGSFGNLADAGVGIFRAKGIGPITKWVDDHLLLHILRRLLEQANAIRQTLHQRIIDSGGVQHIKGRLFYTGEPLPNGRAEEFDDDFTFPLTDHSSDSPCSEEDMMYNYNFADINKISDRLGYIWEISKDIHFCNSPRYFGFEWDIPNMTVSLPLEKRHKYLSTITDWNRNTSHDLEEASSLHGKLLHVSYILPAGRAYLFKLEKLIATLEGAHPHAQYWSPKNLPADLSWWEGRLQHPISRPIPGPVELVDLHAYSDASRGHGIGICCRGYWRAYQLLPGWKGDNEWDIGWAEAVGFWLLTRIVTAYSTKGHHYKIYGDNEGVVEGWWNGRSWNQPTNTIFKHIHKLTEDTGLHFHTRYIHTSHNPADDPSWGCYRPDHLLLPPIPIPDELKQFIIDFNAPLTREEQRSKHSLALSANTPESAQRKHTPKQPNIQQDPAGDMFHVFSPESLKRKKRLPFTIPFISTLLEDLNPDTPLDAAVAGCLTTTFYGGARLGEFTVPRLTDFKSADFITRADVCVGKDQNNFEAPIFHIPKTKSSPVHREDVFWAKQQGPTDPDTHLQNHFHINDPPLNQHLFTYHADNNSSKPLIKRRFLDRINAAAKAKGVNPLQGHGICIGSVLEYLLRGMPFDAVKVVFRWKSDAFLTYLHKHAKIMAPYMQPQLHQDLIRYTLPPVQ